MRAITTPGALICGSCLQRMWQHPAKVGATVGEVSCRSRDCVEYGTRYQAPVQFVELVRVAAAAAMRVPA